MLVFGLIIPFSPWQCADHDDARDPGFLTSTFAEVHVNTGSGTVWLRSVTICGVSASSRSACAMQALAGGTCVAPVGWQRAEFRLAAKRPPDRRVRSSSGACVAG